MRRVAITGMGIVSCLGNDLDTVSANLRDGRSGIAFQPDYAEQGLRSQVAGVPKIDLDQEIDRRHRRFMGDAAAYAYAATTRSLADAGLSAEALANERTGVIAGSGGGSPASQVEIVDTLRNRGVRKIGPYMVPRTMSSTVSASLATAFAIRGTSYSLSAACATSAHCIGAGGALIRSGLQDIVLAGGGEEVHWAMSCQFDAMGALSTNANDTPASASRPYDANRDGFVIAGGGGMLVLEDWEHAQRRGARIHAELVGYGATSDGAGMVAPSGEGAIRCMRQAMAGLAQPVEYINAHATATPLGDLVELSSIGEVFGDRIPPISATKALSGHSLGAAGVHEAIYSLLMMRDGFLAGSANIGILDRAATAYPILLRSIVSRVATVMSNSFGFGGNNASLVFAAV